MGTDFFDGLGAALSKTAKEFGVRAESLYETQKIRSKISGEERAISRLMEDLGKTLYRTYAIGGELTDEQNELCQKIDRHKEVISRCKAEMAGKKGKKICPSCKASLDGTVAFCPYCGAACSGPEPEKETEETAEDAEEKSAEDVMSDKGEIPPETEAPGFRGQQDPKEEETEEHITVEAEE